MAHTPTRLRCSQILFTQAKRARADPPAVQPLQLDENLQQPEPLLLPIDLAD